MTQNYTKTAISLHWLIFLLIVTGASIGLIMVDLPFSPKKADIFSYHKWIGVTVFWLVAIRIIWRLTHAVPSLPMAMKPWERFAANATHALLYVLIFSIPVTGWLYSSAKGIPTVYFGVLQLPDLIGKDKDLASVLRLVHRYLNYTLFAVVALHTAAALKHYLIERDDILTRMIPFLKPLKTNRP